MISETLWSNVTGTKPPNGTRPTVPSTITLKTEDYIRVIFSIIIMVMIVTGNILVMAAYKTNARLQTGTYTLLVSLAFCDFLVGSVSVPLWIYVSLNNWQISKSLDWFFMCFDYITAVSSALHLTVIAIERSLAISRPFLHQILSHKQYSLALAFVWLIAIAVSGCNFVAHAYERDDIYILFLFLVGFLIPFLVISIVNISIFQVARNLIRGEPAAPEPSNAVNEQRNKIQKERKTATTLVIITAVFFFELLPTYIVAVLGAFCLRPCLSQRMGWMDITRLFNFAKWMQYSNSAVNPCVYAFRDTEMRKSFKTLTKRMFMFRRLRIIGQSSDNNSAQSVPTI